MSINYRALLVGNTHAWHFGNHTITYSLLGTTIPGYYDTIDTNRDGVDDAYVIDTEGPITLPIADGTKLTPVNANLAALAVQGWNDVARTNIELGTAGGDVTVGTPITGGGTLVGGLGGPAGFGANVVPRNDDGSQAYDIRAVFEHGINFFGHVYNSIFVNTNGSISFGSGVSAYTPTSITSGLTPMIAPYWGDVDTRTNTTGPSSAPIYVAVDPTSDIITITWAGVGYYSQHADLRNFFQLQLYDRGHGDFDIVFRYQGINWTTGDASGGHGGLGGTPAHAGWTAGDATHFFELPASGNGGRLLALESTIGNTSVTGRWDFPVRAGEVSVGDITFGGYKFTDGFYGDTSEWPGTLGHPDNAGDVWINFNNPAEPGAVYGDDGWQTYLHELGHALGLHHPNEDPNNRAHDPLNNNQYTVMSYVAHPDQADVAGQAQVWPITPMVLDIQAIQSLYGANTATRNRDTTYFGPLVAGSDERAYPLGDDGRMTNGRPIMMTIWDGGGVDTINAANQSRAVSIDLNPGHYSTIGHIENNIGIAEAVNVGGQTVNLIENAIGGAGGDTLIGNDGDNDLDGRGGIDAMRGGGGDDTYHVDNSRDTVTETVSEGTDRVLTSVSYALAAGSEVEFLSTNNSAARSAINLSGNEFKNTITGNAGDNVIRDGGGLDILTGLAGNDDYYVTSAGVVVNESAGGGTDHVLSSVSYALRNGTYVEILSTDNAAGTARIDLSGNNFANTVIGNAGINVLNGRGGVDILQGLKGSDYYIVDNRADLVIERAHEGSDRVSALVSYALATGSSVEILVAADKNSTTPIDLTGNEIANVIQGSAGNNILNGKGGEDDMTGFGGNDTYFVDLAGDLVHEAAGEGSDRVLTSVSYTLRTGVSVELLMAINRAGRGEIHLTGNEIAQRIDANQGDNIIDGKGGADTMSGFGGNDTYVVDNAGDVVFEAAGAGSDHVLASASHALRAGQSIELLTTTNRIARSAINLTGNDVAQKIEGNAGNNIIDGKGGADALYGFGGNDTYFVDNIGDRVFEARNGGTDQVNTSINYALAGAQSIEVLATANPSAVAPLQLTGNDLVQSIFGNRGNNVIDGRGGADTMSGGFGNDTYIVDNAGDRVLEAAGAGNDQVQTSVAYALTPGQSIELLTTVRPDIALALNLTGNDLAQKIVGDRGNNVIDGKGGADEMVGGFGNDFYFVDNAGDQVTEAASGGTDQVAASVSYALGAGSSVELLTTTNGAARTAINLTGNELANDIVGNAGNNVIDGKGGRDTMTGLGGNDTYIVDNADDEVGETSGGGSDRINTSVSYQLFAGASVERLATTNAAGTSALTLIGNEIDNIIEGNAGNNILKDTRGHDVMSGFSGDDTYFVDSTADVVNEAAGGGSDRVLASVNFALKAGQSIETLSTTASGGTFAINLTGNAFAQTIYGNAGANVIDGRGGADNMYGGGGNDTFLVDNAADRVFEAAGGGTDQVSTSVTYALTAGQSIEFLTTTNSAGTSAIKLTGNELAQTIIGNAGNNIIDGKAGANILNGGKGNDTLIGLGGKDTFVFDTTLSATTNVDQITSFVHGVDRIVLENAVFTKLPVTGMLAAGAFFIGTAAHDADDRIIYNPTTGALTYDANGNVAGGAFRFATLADSLVINNTDFFVT